MTSSPSGPTPPSPAPVIPQKKKKVPGADPAQFRALARERLREAQILFTSGKFDGAAYLCGYAIEFALKARICRTLKWTEYKIGKGFESFKTHDLNDFLFLSGIRPKIISPKYIAEWSAVFVEWNEHLRYAPIGYM